MRMSSSFQSLRTTTVGFSGTFSGTKTNPPPPELFFFDLLLRCCSFSRRRASSFLRFTSARTSALLRASSAYTMKSCPSSFTQCDLSAVRMTKTTPSSPTGASMVHADHPGAPRTGSISVSHDAPPVPHELAGTDTHPCGGCFHSPAGSDCVAQCSTVSWSERSITIV